MATLTARAFEGQRRFHIPTATAPSSVKVNAIVRADYTFTSGLVLFNAGLTQGDTVEFVFTYPTTGVDGPGGGGSGFSGAYADLTGKPTLFSGAYGDLSGKPSLGSAAAVNTGTANGNVPLVGADGKLPAGVIPTTTGGNVDWTLLVGTTPFGSTQFFSSIPQTYSDLMFVFDSIYLNNGGAIQLALSADGSSYTNNYSVCATQATGATIHGGIFLANYRRSPTLVDARLSTINVVGPTIGYQGSISPGGPVTHVRLTASNGLAGSGTINLYGR